MLASVKAKLGMAAAPPAPPPLLPQQLLQSAAAALDEHTPTLSWKQRAIGFGICFGLGLLMSFLVCAGRALTAGHRVAGGCARHRARARRAAAAGCADCRRHTSCSLRPEPHSPPAHTPLVSDPPVVLPADILCHRVLHRQHPLTQQVRPPLQPLRGAVARLASHMTAHPLPPPPRPARARSTMFLMGPCKQMRSMMQSGRWIASLVYVTAIVLTLVVAFTLSGVAGVALVLVLIVAQLLAFVWWARGGLRGGGGGWPGGRGRRVCGAVCGAVCGWPAGQRAGTALHAGARVARQPVVQRVRPSGMPFLAHCAPCHPPPCPLPHATHQGTVQPTSQVGAHAARLGAERASHVRQPAAQACCATPPGRHTPRA